MTARVLIDPSQFPETGRRDLLRSGRARTIPHTFHYDSVKQTMAWLDLHAAYSPSRVDPECAAVYDEGFKAAARRLAGKASAELIGLGCGGGQKDTRLLRELRAAGVSRLAYVPSDVSVAMVLTARQAALEVVSDKDCHPFVCDLATVSNLADTLDAALRGADRGGKPARLLTFFGMIPNFEPDEILPKLADCLRPTDLLLFSANLSPGPDYDAGVARILPLYDNQLTRDWLFLILRDAGVLPPDGSVQFELAESKRRGGLKRVQAWFQFSKAVAIRVEGETFQFHPGERIQLFFSYRLTPALAATLLSAYQLKVIGQWITPSEEEGVFLCQRA